MRCEDVRRALSARLDGEASGIADDILDAHMEYCDSCQQWYSQVAKQHRAMKISLADAAAQPPEGAANALLAKLLDEPSALPAGSYRQRQLPLLVARLVLAGLAIASVLWAAWLMFASEYAQTVQDAPATAQFVFESATYRFALGVGLGWAAFRPHVASALLPMYLALWAFGAGFATRNFVLELQGATGNTGPMLGLLLNFLAVVALIVCWLGRHHQYTPLRESWNILSAKPITGA